MSMIERVARALCIADGHDPDFNYDPKGLGGGPDIRWRLYIPQARAVIEEMRKPTKFMLVAGARSRTADGRFYTGDDTLEPEWAAMIDAALEEGK